MESVLGRYRNLIILVGILFLQVLGLAVQIKRATENESSRLIRVWAVNAITPLEKSIVWIQNGAGDLWHNYFYLRGVRQENRQLKQKIEQLQIEQARLSEDAEQAHRLQALLGFKEQFIAKTLAAQVIGSSGSEQSRSIYIDKGARDGLKPDTAVITADGVVGKVLHVYRSTSQVLLINDQTSGVGAILEKSRLQGVMRGTPLGEVVLEKVMEGEAVQPGESVLTSGGDQIFPKGLPVGTVTKVSRGSDLFLNIRVKPAANLSKLEEVLVITQLEEREPVVSESGRLRAADILAQRLPSVPEKPPGQASNIPPPTSGLKILPAPATPANPVAVGPKPSGVAPSAQTQNIGAPQKTQPGGATIGKSASSAPAKPAATPGVNAAVPPNPAARKPASDRNAPQPKVPPQSGPAVVKPAPSPTEPSPPQDRPQ
ncbi:MAG: rod shape-determining protein MreC [Acidobacteriia bacterium]|nr:rod shape-determining protein MreC [Terriglobia bacterium]